MYLGESSSFMSSYFGCSNPSLSLYLWEAPIVSISIYRHGVNPEEFNPLLYNLFSLTAVYLIYV
jgi:hypothetical protein